MYEYLLILLEPRIDLVETNLQPALEIAMFEELGCTSRATVVHNDVVRVRLGVTTSMLEVNLVDVVDGDIVQRVEDVFPTVREVWSAPEWKLGGRVKRCGARSGGISRAIRHSHKLGLASICEGLSCMNHSDTLAALLRVANVREGDRHDEDLRD